MRACAFGRGLERAVLLIDVFVYRFLKDFEAGGDEGGMMLNPVVLNMVSDQVGVV